MSSQISPLHVLGLSALLLLSACSDKQAVLDTPTELLTVETEKVVEHENYKVVREYVGSVKSGQNANLGFELSGKISELLVDVGDAVTKGQALIRLDTQLLNTQRKQLEAQLLEVKAQRKLSESNLARHYSLNKKGFSSESEIDRLNSEKEALEANLLRIQSTINENKLRAEKSTITAPYAGVVSKRFVSLGNVVPVGEPALSLLSNGNKEAVIGVLRSDIKGLEAQKNHVIRIGPQEYNAELIANAAAVDINSRTVSLRFLLEENSPALDGELAYLSYKKEYPTKGFWVPNTALVDGIRGTWNVYVVSNASGQPNVESRAVQVLFSNSESTYVQGGLASDDELIISGIHRVVPGQSVKIAAEERS